MEVMFAEMARAYMDTPRTYVRVDNKEYKPTLTLTREPGTLEELPNIHSPKLKTIQHNLSDMSVCHGTLHKGDVRAPDVRDSCVDSTMGTSKEIDAPTMTPVLAHTKADIPKILDHTCDTSANCSTCVPSVKAKPKSWKERFEQETIQKLPQVNTEIAKPIVNSWKLFLSSTLSIVCLLTNILVLSWSSTQAAVQAITQHGTLCDTPAHLFVDRGTQLEKLDDVKFLLWNIHVTTSINQFLATPVGSEGHQQQASGDAKLETTITITQIWKKHKRSISQQLNDLIKPSSPQTTLERNRLLILALNEIFTQHTNLLIPSPKQAIPGQTRSPPLAR